MSMVVLGVVWFSWVVLCVWFHGLGRRLIVGIVVLCVCVCVVLIGRGCSWVRGALSVCGFHGRRLFAGIVCGFHGWCVCWCSV